MTHLIGDRHAQTITDIFGAKDFGRERVGKGYADFISMSRPFVREPFLVKKFKEGKAAEASCVSCNKCFETASSNTTHSL